MTILSCMFISSCSDSVEVSDEDLLIGTWTGGLIQPDFGTLHTEFRITSLDKNSGRGSGSFRSEAADITNCDDVQFNCSPLSCDFTITLLSLSGGLYEFDQIVDTNTGCGDGKFEIRLSGDDRITVIWYEESFPINRATGTLEKQ